MRRIVQVGVLATVCALVLWPERAEAQRLRCPEGRTITGACVNPPLAMVMRRTAIIFSQPNLSRTAYPVPPSGDRMYRYPNQLIPNPLHPTPCCGPPIP
jgi:hypothetical protein